MSKSIMVPKLKIKIGSQNKVKIGAVTEILRDYPHLAHAALESVDASSEVSDQPKSLDETIQGATNRARNAFRDCDYSIGLESGLMLVPNTKTGYMDVCVCAIYDGKEFSESPEVMARRQAMQAAADAKLAAAQQLQSDRDTIAKALESAKDPVEQARLRIALAGADKLL